MCFPGKIVFFHYKMWNNCSIFCQAGIRLSEYWLLQKIGDWGLGIGDWGLGIGDWGLGIGSSKWNTALLVVITTKIQSPISDSNPPDQISSDHY